MPPADKQEALKPLRELVFGPPKAKKTWWAAKAAEAGFNVVLVDGDDGTHILNQISDEAKSRIQIVDAVDKLNKSIMAVFMVNLLKGKPFVWDEQVKSMIVGNKNDEHSHYTFDVSKFTMNDVLIIDSWTALSWSVAFRYCIENAIDLSNATKTEWDGYGWSGRMLNWILNQLSALPCHVIVIGHQDEYSKRKSDGKTVEFTRTQVKSVSGPHSMQIAKHFSDVLFFKIVGSAFKIDASANKDRDGGSRNIEPKTFDWNELQFGDIYKASGFPDNTVTPQPCKAVVYYKPGKEIELGSIKPNSGVQQTLKATTAQGNKPGGKFAGLLQNSKTK